MVPNHGGGGGATGQSFTLLEFWLALMATPVPRSPARQDQGSYKLQPRLGGSEVAGRDRLPLSHLMKRVVPVTDSESAEATGIIFAGLSARVGGKNGVILDALPVPH